MSVLQLDTLSVSPTILFAVLELPFQFDDDYVERVTAQVLRQMASGGRIERLACTETALFRFAVRECKPAVYIVQKNCDTFWM